jgi:hypothetical protein
MTKIVNELLSKIKSFPTSDYSVSHDFRGTNYTIQSRELAKTLRQILTPEPYLSIEGEINKMEGSGNDGSYYIYQGDASFTSDRLMVGNAYESNPNLLKINSSFPLGSYSQISEITDAEALKFEEQGAKVVHSSFSSFPPTNGANDYHRNENREIKQREFEKRQRELKEQEEKLAIEQKKLGEEMKAETQQSQSQNFQPNRDGQGGGSIPPVSSF